MSSKNKLYWKFCSRCKGLGRKIRKSKSANRLKNPIINKSVSYRLCNKCNGSGIIQSIDSVEIDNNIFPHVSIIGAGISGLALGVACLHRGIPFTIYERDLDFDTRLQGYGLTLQQASRAVKSFGITSLDKAIISTKHIVHNQKGEVVGTWGIRKWLGIEDKKTSKRTNVHVARQSLRLELLEQLEDVKSIKWNHQLVSFNTNDSKVIELTFLSSGVQKKIKSNFVVGCDGIHSTFRKKLFKYDKQPLQYLGCIVILGICPVKNLSLIKSDLLDLKTVFQTSNGTDRMYMMPYDTEKIMWQFSFLLSEEKAKKLASKGSEVLKSETYKRVCPWHSPIPEIIYNTNASTISGYPVYDRLVFDIEQLSPYRNCTLIGDALHPMSPFKGQGANQALLDALNLARSIFIKCKSSSQWKTKGLRNSILNDFEIDMIKRTEKKVLDSSKAVKLLHSKSILRKVNAPRGRE